MSHPLAILQVLLIFLINQAVLPVNSPQVIVDEVELNFPEGLVFHLEIASGVVVERVTLVYSSNGRSCQPGKARKDLDFTPAKDLQLEWEWDFTHNGTIPPGVIVEWQWEITDSLGNVTLTEPGAILVQDQRHDWQQISRDGITIQWYAAGDAFGNDLYAVAFDGRQHVIDLLGIEFEEDVWITVYPSPDDVRDALKFNTQWTGGIAFTDHNAMIVPGAPGQEDWLNQVIPHEFAHFIAEAYIHNCMGNWMPAWFGEGLAEYTESDLNQHDLDLIQSAHDDGHLPSLRSLVTSFSFDPQQARLDYRVSKSVFNFLVQEYGSQQMGALLDQLQAGKMIDPALQQVYGFDTDGLEAAWRQNYGFDKGDAASSNEADLPGKTPIPTLALYAPVVETVPSATPEPEPAVASIPSASPGTGKAVGLVQSLVPGAARTPAPSPFPTGPLPANRQLSSPGLTWIIPLIVLLGGAMITVLIFLLRRV